MIGRATNSGPTVAADAGFHRHLLEEHAVPVALGPTFCPAPHSHISCAIEEAEPRTTATLCIAARAAEALS